MRWTSRKIVALSLAALLAVCEGACSKKHEDPESQPTPILGSGRLFTYAEGQLRCVGNYLGNAHAVFCVGIMPPPASTGVRLADPYADWVPVVGFEPEISSYSWGDLVVQSGASSTIVSTKTVSPDGVSAIYDLPLDLSIDQTTLTASLQVTRVSQGTPEQRTVQIDAPLSPPLPVNNLVASTPSGPAISLAWMPPMGGLPVTKIAISFQQGTNNTIPCDQAQIVIAPTTGYIISSLQPSTVYTAAVCAGGDGGYSAPVLATAVSGP